MKQRKSKRKQRRQRKTVKKYGGALTDDDIIEFVQTNQLDILKFLLQKGAIGKDLNNFILIMITALKCDNVNIANWAFDMCNKIDAKYPYKEDYTVLNQIYGFVCMRGYFNSIKWMLRKFTSISQEFRRVGAIIAAGSGYLQILDWMFNAADRELNYRLFIDKNEVINGSFISAAHKGQLAIMQWILNSYENIITNNTIGTAFERAAQYGHLDILVFINDKFNTFITDQTLDAAFTAVCNASNNNKLNVLLWLRDLNTRRNVNPFRYEVKVNEANQLVSCGILPRKDVEFNNLMYSLDKSESLEPMGAEVVDQLRAHF